MTPIDSIRHRPKINCPGMDMRPISLLAGQRPTKATIGRGSERKVLRHGPNSYGRQQ